MLELEPERPFEAPQGSFLGHVNIVMFTYVLDGTLSFASGVLVARALHTEGRGAFSLFVISAALLQMVLGVGFGNAALYFINKRELALQEIMSAAHVVTIGSLAVTAALVATIAPWAGASVLGERVSPWLLIAAVPVIVYAAALRILLQALSRFAAMGVATIVQPVVMLVLVAADYAFGDPSPSRMVAFWIASNGATALVSLVLLGVANIDLSQIVRPRWPVLKKLARFGVQGETGNILQLMNYRLDQYLVRGFVSLAGVGIYAVSVSVSEGVWMIANAVAIVLQPRLTSADDDDVRWMAPVAARNTILIATCTAVVLAAAAPILLPALFGNAYDGVVTALWLLLPGTVALTGSKVLTSYIFSQGRPLVNTLITTASLVVTLVALIALVPPFGVNGAAAASSIAYAAHFVAALYAYRRISGQPVLEAIVPRRSDARLYRDALRDVIARVSRRRSTAGVPATPATPPGRS
jgi:O-antigen/teichoic acid export membrane protein